MMPKLTCCLLIAASAGCAAGRGPAAQSRTALRPEASFASAGGRAEGEALAAGEAEADAWPMRGGLVSSTHLRTLTAAQAADELARSGFDAGPVRYGVDTYQLIYRTVDAGGRPTTASGLVALPRGGGAFLRAVSYAHGTEVARADAPSAQEACLAGADRAACPDAWAVAPAITYASAGFAAVAPDYLGLGAGPGHHPWMNVPSETTASLDMLRAAGGFGLQQGLVLRREALVTGFSQGASAALGLARALDARADAWFRLGAVAPISGAYDFSGWVRGALGGEVEPLAASFYLSYLLVSWNRLHHLYASPGEAFAAPYADGVEALFDGSHGGDEVAAGVGATPGAQLTSHAFELLGRPTGPLASAFAAADGACSGWSPRAPVRLFYARGDGEVPNANTSSCLKALRASGARPGSVDLGDIDHLASNVEGTAAVVRWFRELP